MAAKLVAPTVELQTKQSSPISFEKEQFGLCLGLFGCSVTFITYSFITTTTTTTTTTISQ
jgi:hypothetical protein